ncbi:MAG: hypothetical protein R6U46_00015 [Marinilabilia sp.]
MKKNPKRRTDFRHITSYKDLRAEKIHLAYRVRYSKKQLELRLLEIGYFLHPVRLVPSLVTEWAQPMLQELKIRIKEYFFGGKRKRRRKEASREDFER